MDLGVHYVTTTSHDRVLPPIEELTDTAGRFNLIAKYIKSCTHHKTRVDLGDREITWKNKGDASKWNRLIKALSTNVTKDVIFPKSSRLAGCGGSIQCCVEDLVEHLLFSIVSEGVPAHEFEGRSDEELMHLLVANIMKRATTEFSQEGKTTEEHFIALAENLLLTAFPGRWEDPHLPDAVRSWGFKKAVGDPEDLWQSAVKGLADFGVQVYDSLHKMDTVDVENLEAEHPGIKKLVGGIVSETHKRAKSSELYRNVQIPHLDDSSSAFVVEALTQILSPEELTYQLDREILASFNGWADERLEHSLYAVFDTLFKTHPGQSPTERRIEVFNLLFSRVASCRAELQSRRALIDQQDLSGVKSMLREAQRSLRESTAPAKELVFYQRQIDEFLSNDAVTEVQGKALLLNIASYQFSRSVFEYSRHSGDRGETVPTFLGVDKREFEAYFTDFFTFETALDLIHSSVGDYFLELQEQSAAVAAQGAAAVEYLRGAERGDKLLATVDDLIGKYSVETESRAKTRLLKPTEFELINEIICQLLEPSVVERSGRSLAKELAADQVKNVVMVCLADTIKRHQVEDGSGDVCIDDGIARLTSELLEISQDGIRSIQSKMQTLTPDEYTPAALKAKAEGIHLDGSLREFSRLRDGERREKFLELELAALSQTLLQEVVSEELFSALLPAMLKDAHIMEAAASLLTPYVRGFYDKAVKGAQSPDTLTVAPEMRPLLDKVQAELRTFVAVDATAPGFAQHERALLFDILDKINQQKSVHAFAESTLDQISEAVMAYHLNPTDEKTSERRGAELFWQLRLHFEGCRQHIAQLRLADDKEAYFQTMSEPSLIAEYRRVNNLAASAVLDKVDYLKWQEAHILFEILVPAEMLEMFATQELIPTIRDQLTLAIKGQVDNYYLYSVLMDKTIAGGMAKMEAEGNEAFGGTGRVVRAKVHELLDGLKDGAIKTDDPWINGVLVTIVGTDDEQQMQMLERLGFETLYGLLAQAVSGQEYSEDQTSLLLSTFDRDFIPQLDAAFSGEDEVDYSAYLLQILDSFYSDEKWEKLMHPLLRSVLSKKNAADMLGVYLKAIHRTHRGLETRSEQVRDLIRTNPELGITEEYIDETLVAPVQRTIAKVAASSKPLSAGIAPPLDKLAKQVLGANNDSLSNIGEIREKLVAQGVYTALHNVLSQAPSPSSYAIEQLVELKKTYEGSYESRDFQQCARQLLDAILPDDVWEDLFKDSGIELLPKYAVLPVITEYLVDISDSQAFVKAGSRAAREWLDEVDGQGGLQELLVRTIENVNATIDAYGAKEGNVVEGQPPLVNEILKGVLASDDLSPVLKQTTEDLLYILAHRALTPKPPNSNIQQEFVSFCDRLRIGYDDPKAGEMWLRELLPEDLRLKLVPKFLHNALTHEWLNELILKPWFVQVQATVAECEKWNETTPEGAEGIYSYLVDYLAVFGGPDSPRRGLTDFGGAVRQVEQGLLSQVRSPKTETEKVLDGYLRATSAQIATRLGESGRLEKSFLSNAMLAALPAFQGAASAQPYTGKAENFNSAAADKVLNDLFPGGKQELLVPDGAKEAVWEKARESIGNQFRGLTERDRRIVYTLKKLDSEAGLSQREVDDRADRYHRLLASSKSDHGVFMKTSKKLVQKGYWSKMKSQLTGWKQLLKPFAWIAFHVSLKHSLWETVSSTETDARMRNFLWSALAYKQTNKTPEVGEVEDAFTSVFSSTGLVPWGFRGYAAKPAAAMIYDRNFVDMITPREA